MRTYNKFGSVVFYSGSSNLNRNLNCWYSKYSLFSRIFDHSNVLPVAFRNFSISYRGSYTLRKIEVIPNCYSHKSLWVGYKVMLMVCSLVEQSMHIAPAIDYLGVAMQVELETAAVEFHLRYICSKHLDLWIYILQNCISQPVKSMKFSSPALCVGWSKCRLWVDSSGQISGFIAFVMSWHVNPKSMSGLGETPISCDETIKSFKLQ